MMHSITFHSTINEDPLRSLGRVDFCINRPPSRDEPRPSDIVAVYINNCENRPQFSRLVKCCPLNSHAIRTCRNAPARTWIPLMVLVQLQVSSSPSSSYSLIGNVSANLSRIRIPAHTE